MLNSLRYLRSIQAHPYVRLLKRILRLLITPVLFLDYLTSRNIVAVDFPSLTNKNSKIFVFAHHSNSSLDEFDLEILNSTKKLGFYTVLVTNLKVTNQDGVDLVLKKGNRGRDLGILRDFARISESSTYESIEILFCNNSMIWDTTKFEKLVVSLSEYPADTLVFPSNSNNPFYHVQPYLMYVKLSKRNYAKFQQSFEWIKNLRLKRSTVKFSEYPMSRKLTEIGWKHCVIAQYEDVHKSFLMLHKGEASFKKLTSSNLLNPTQEMWDGLILSGIPGIKRTLVSANPVGVMNPPKSLEVAFNHRYWS